MKLQRNKMQRLRQYSYTIYKTSFIPKCKVVLQYIRSTDTSWQCLASCEPVKIINKASNLCSVPVYSDSLLGLAPNSIKKTLEINTKVHTLGRQQATALHGWQSWPATTVLLNSWTVMPTTMNQSWNRKKRLLQLFSWFFLPSLMSLI
jgi:hypothetical protein